MFYTSYFGKLKKINELQNYIPISICGKAPDWYNGLQYKKVAPKYKFFMEWKENHDNEFYKEHYKKEVLDTLDWEEVTNDILNLLPKNIQELVKMVNCPLWENPFVHIVFLCYEKPNDFCHRHLYAKWLNENNIKCTELEI